MAPSASVAPATSPWPRSYHMYIGRSATIGWLAVTWADTPVTFGPTPHVPFCAEQLALFDRSPRKTSIVVRLVAGSVRVLIGAGFPLASVKYWMFAVTALAFGF